MEAAQFNLSPDQVLAPACCALQSSLPHTRIRQISPLAPGDEPLDLLRLTSPRLAAHAQLPVPCERAQLKQLRLPNTDGVMTPVSRLVYDDAPWLSTSVQVQLLLRRRWRISVLC